MNADPIRSDPRSEDPIRRIQIRDPIRRYLRIRKRIRDPKIQDPRSEWFFLSQLVNMVSPVWNVSEEIDNNTRLKCKIQVTVNDKIVDFCFLAIKIFVLLKIRSENSKIRSDGSRSEIRNLQIRDPKKDPRSDPTLILDPK